MTLVDIIRCNSAPLDPVPTEVAPRLPAIPGIRAVLFDVYGTLIISASGDISLTSGVSQGEAADQACSEAGLVLTCCRGDDVVAELHAEIARQHDASEVEFPEVDILEVWRNTLDRLLQASKTDWTLESDELARLAIEYESRVNPVWPMPGLLDCLAEVRNARLLMGIVSNAQAFTKELFPALTGSSTTELGFTDDLCIWSYEHRQAKPGRYLYELAQSALAARGIRPYEVFYVGNDMRNDIAPAAAVGFRTGLFAGDARSLRLREGERMVAGVEPDAVITDLRQVLHVLCLAPRRQ